MRLDIIDGSIGLPLRPNSATAIGGNAIGLCDCLSLWTSSPSEVHFFFFDNGSTASSPRCPDWFLRFFPPAADSADFDFSAPASVPPGFDASTGFLESDSTFALGFLGFFLMAVELSAFLDSEPGPALSAFNLAAFLAAFSLISFLVSCLSPSVSADFKSFDFGFFESN